MKLQHLAIIFVIIILPISMVISSYIQTQIDTISLQRIYNTKLQTATYDAIKAFQLNTLNNKYSTVSDSKIRDIEASISTFYNSLGTEMGASGYDKESMQQFIPALVYTMYDGYYIHGKYYNDNEQEYQFGLRPYIYYSCRYIDGDDDFVVNYTLDNYITVYGNVNGEYAAKSGPLIDPSLFNEENGEYYYGKTDGEKVKIEPEILKEQLIILDNNRQPQSTEAQYYEYITYQNKKVYFDGVGNYFWYDNNQKKIITDTDTLKFVNKWTYGGHLHSNSAIEYYKTAKKFSEWVITNLGNIEQRHAKDLNGNAISDFAIDTGTEKIFKFSETNNPFLDSSTFNQNRVSVIRRVIQTTLNTAIANYSSVANYEFAMPVLSEEDWDKLVNNISVVSFMQGVPIGAKYYNNYCVVANNKNKEVVQKDSIYVITDDDNGENANDDEAHIASSKDIVNKNVIAAYRNIDFEAQSIVRSEGNEVYYYPHANNKCYNCMINVTPTYSIDDIIAGSIKEYNNETDEYEVNNTISNSNEFKKLRKIYLTALAREKYDLYEGVRLEKIEEVYSEEPIIRSIAPTPTTAIIRAQGINGIYSYAITQSPTVPTEFMSCNIGLEGSVTASGLEPNQIYYAWVRDTQNHISNYKQFTTTVLKAEDIIFTLNPNTWTNGNVEVTADTEVPGFDELQTSTNGINYTDSSVQTFDQNGTMYARFTRRPDVVASINITTIDKEAPKVIEVIPSLYDAEIIATDNASGIVGYAITKLNEKLDKTSESFVTCERTQNLNVTVSEYGSGTQKYPITPNAKYYISLKDAAGNVSDPHEFTTGPVTARILFEEVIWDKDIHKASVRIKTDTRFTIKYQVNATTETLKDNSKWIESNNVTNLKVKDIVYACLSDGTNRSDFATLTIEDGITPQNAKIELNATGATIESNIKATITHIDNESGVNITKCKWVYNTDKNPLGIRTEDESKYTGRFSKNDEEITLETRTTGEYYLHVLTVDEAGNKIETISEKIKVTLKPNIVTYYVDEGEEYEELVNYGETCLNPKTFTPKKKDWIFVGWRENSQASSQILNSKTMGDSPIQLYAVFKKEVIVTCYDYNNNAGEGESPYRMTQYPGYKYYNNRNEEYPKLNITAARRNKWNFIGWSETGETEKEIIVYTENQKITYENGEEKKREEFKGFKESITLFAIYQKNITVYYYNNSNSIESVNTTIKSNSSGADEYGKVTIEQEEKDGWTKLGWSETKLENTQTATIDRVTNEKEANAEINYGTIENTQFSQDVLLFAMYVKDDKVEVTYYNNSTTPFKEIGRRYYNSIIEKGPIFTIPQDQKRGWTQRGWGTSQSAETPVVYNEINNTEITSDVTLYGLYYKTITLSYNGNGEGVTGSVSAQTGNAYYNSAGNTKNPTFTIKSNGFTRTKYIFKKWALGSASGTQYSPGETTPELSSNKTLYAIWEPNSKYILNVEDTDLSYYWHRETTPNNGWGQGTASDALEDLVTFDCTDYNYCRVRIKGSISSTPSGQVANHTYIRLGFNTYEDASNVVHKWTSSPGLIGNGQEGCLDVDDKTLGYTKFGELTFNISALTGEQTLKMFCGNSYQNGGKLYITEIYLYN